MCSKDASFKSRLDALHVIKGLRKPCDRKRFVAACYARRGGFGALVPSPTPTVRRVALFRLALKIRGMRLDISPLY